MHAPCSKRAARGRAGQYARPQALATVYMCLHSRLVCVCVCVYRAGQYARPQARMYACSRMLLRPVVLYTIRCSSVAAVASQARICACSRILLRPVVLYTVYMPSCDYIHACCSNMLALRHAYDIRCSSVAALLQLLHLRHAHARVLAYYCVLCY
jgi:hypothetical protein